MSNIKLKDHNWAAEGIYDTNQSKTQQVINAEVSTKIGQATLQTTSPNLSGATNELKGRADTLDSKYDNVVTVSNTQPSSQYNKVWLPITVGEGTSVPTWAEHQALETSFNSLHKIYSAPSELGLSGTPTLIQVIAAMPNGSILVGHANSFDTSGMTYTGEVTCITILKHDGNRTYIIGVRSYASATLAQSKYYFATYAYNSGSPFVNGWVKLETADYKSGDTLTFGTATILTFFAGSTEKAYVNIPLSKKIGAGLTISHNLTVGWIRGGSVDARGTVTAVTRANDNCLNIEITVNSGYSLTKWDLYGVAIIGTVTFS